VIARLAMGKNALVPVLLTTEELVKIRYTVDGETVEKVVWVNTREVYLTEEGGKINRYTVINEDGKKIVAEIVEDLKVTRRFILAYAMDNSGNMKAIPILYIGKSNKISEEASEAVKKMRELGIRTIEITTNKKGTAELIILDPSKIIPENSPVTDEYKEALYCTEQLLNLKVSVKEDLSKAFLTQEEIKKYYEHIDILTENIRKAIGDRSPRSGAMLLGLHEDPSGLVYGLVDPFYAGRSKWNIISPEALFNDKKAGRLMELFGYMTITEKDGKISTDYRGKKKAKIRRYQEAWRNALGSKHEKVSPQAAALNFFLQNAFTAEAMAILYDTDPKNIRVGEINKDLKTIIDIAYEVEGERAKHRTNWVESAIKSLSEEKNAWKLELIGMIIGNPDVKMDIISLREADPDVILSRVIDLSIYPLRTITDGSCANLERLKFIGRNLVDVPEIALRAALNDKQFKGIQGNLGPAFGYIKSEIDRLYVNLEIELNKVKSEDERKQIRELLKQLEEVRKLIRSVMKDSEEELVTKAKSNGRGTGAIKLFTHFYLMILISNLLFTGGVALALTLIKKFPRFFGWLAMTRWAQILLGVVTTVIFILGTNIDTGWLSSIRGILNNAKQGIRKLLRSMFMELKEGNNVVDQGGFVLGMLIAGFGMVMKGIGVEFYTSDEICYKIGEYLGMLNPELGNVWDMVMGFRIPLLDQTVFDVLLNVALGGPVQFIVGAIVGVIMDQVILPTVNNLVLGAIVNLLSETILL